MLLGFKPFDSDRQNALVRSGYLRFQIFKSASTLVQHFTGHANSKTLTGSLNLWAATCEEGLNKLNIVSFPLFQDGAAEFATSGSIVRLFLCYLQGIEISVYTAHNDAWESTVKSG